jgi:cytochrome c biogenesis protein CcdA
VLIAGIGLAGWYGWTTLVLPLAPLVDPASPLALALFGLLTGTAALFAPCAFPLFPAYVTVYLLGGALSGYLIAAKPLIALILVGAGVATLADLSLPLANRPVLGKLLVGQAAQRRPLVSLFLYGFGYGLASTGCTLPIYVGLVVFPLSSGEFARALTAFVSFAVAMGGLMMLLTVCIGLSKRTLIQHLMASTAPIRKAAGVVLIVIGLYLGYYFLKAGM